MKIFELVSDISSAMAIVGCVYLLVASAVVLRFSRRRGQPKAPAVPVTILKPLHGAEPRLAERIQAYCEQRYEGELQMICGVRDHADPATEAVRIAQDAVGPRIELRIDPLQHGGNRKVSNLVNMARDARHEILVLSDSDIEVDQNYLTNVVSWFAQPDVGAVTCLYHGVPSKALWSRYAALAINAHFLPSVVLAISFGLARPCFGSTIAIRQSTLQNIGGLQAFADCLADDHAIGMAVRSAGRKVSIATSSLGHLCFEKSLKALFSNEVRAARTIRQICPLGHCGSVITHPLPMALIDFTVGGHHGLVLIVAALASRALLCESVRHAFGLARQPHELIPARDLLSFAVFVTSLFGHSVEWRGTTLEMRRNGKIQSDGNRSGVTVAPSE
ncbi:bacteriohopanetetrol glucosamine biosynthesis glycosyltransferase HpnI [Methylosinus sp. KRF6]|uniref:bacteriohopanetetrol glucosamine biosynthesis glycosyltransferase HpnI n=1 Tax=Methylosinus sp. KRF6 TaxID=2846853 RepID=UPI00352FF898